MTTETTIVSGTAFYASIHKPNKISGKYGLDLSVDADTATKLKALGLKPRRHGESKDFAMVEHESGKSVFKFSKFASFTDPKTGETTPTKGPTAVDAKNNIMKDLIGNGSKVNISFSVRSGKLKDGKAYTTADLKAIQVVDLVHYEAGGSISKPSFFAATEGFTTSASTDSSSNLLDGDIL